MSIQEISPSKSPMWSMFEPEPEDNTTQNYDWVRIPYLSSGGSAITGRGEINMNIPDTSQWYDFSKAEIEVRYKIVVKSSGAILSGQDIALTNNAYHIFDRFRWTIGNTVVTDISEELGALSDVMNLVCWSQDNSISLGSGSNFYPETYAGTAVSDQQFTLNATDYVQAVDDDDGTGTVISDTYVELPASVSGLNTTYSESFARRKARALASRVDTVLLPIRDVSGFWREYTYPMRGMPHKLTLRQADLGTQLQGSSAGGGTVECSLLINELNLWVAIATPSLKTQLYLDEKLKSGMSRVVRYNDLVVQKSQTVSTAGNQVFPIHAGISKAQRVYVVFRKRSRLVQDANSACYDHLQISELQCKVNGKPVPADRYQPNFDGADENYTRLYKEYLRAGYHCQDSESGSIVDFKSFKDIYPIFVFDVSKNNTDKAAFSYETIADILLEYRNVDASAHEAIAIVESLSEVQISGDGDRLVVSDGKR